MKPAIAFLAFAAFCGSAGAQIFADFQTSAGNFTCELNHTAAPKAVANFIGLAEGSRAWVDPATGAVRFGEPFYNGVTFHRVIKDFMSQSGSRNGLGTDGPGYVFRDEFPNGLTHSGPYILSMANSGTHSNGSQFFITDAATPNLDTKHTVFGSVTHGQAVVDAINDAPVGPNAQGETSSPLNPVTINSVTIRRVGASAEVFNIHAQGLANASGAAGRLEVIPGTSVTFKLTAPQPAGSLFRVFRSHTLQSWDSVGSLYRGTGIAGAQDIIIDSGTLSRAFYQLPIVVYPDALTPQSTGSRTLVVNFSGNTLRCDFNAAGTGGTGTYNSSPLTITSASYSRGGPYAATWIVISEQLNPLRVRANLNGEDAVQIQGTHQIDQHNGLFWATIASGTLTLTK